LSKYEICSKQAISTFKKLKSLKTPEESNFKRIGEWQQDMSHTTALQDNSWLQFFALIHRPVPNWPNKVESLCCNPMPGVDCLLKWEGKHEQIVLAFWTIWWSSSSVYPCPDVFHRQLQLHLALTYCIVNYNLIWQSEEELNTLQDIIHDPDI